jgi:hypothetical protein
MAETPAASPSSPSMKLSALTIRTVNRMVSGTPMSGPKVSVPMSATGRNT